MIEIEAPRARLARWAIAVALVLAIKCGAVAWIAMPTPTDERENEAAGAFLLELSPITASPGAVFQHVAIGEMSRDSQAVAALKSQKAAIAPAQEIEDPRTPERPEPQQDALQRPDDKPPEVFAPQESKSTRTNEAPDMTPAEASVAAAPQKIDEAAENSVVPRGQNTGLSRSDRAALANWRRDLMVHINRFKRYPAAVRRSGSENVVLIAFTLDRQGRLIRSAVTRSAGIAELDQAAIDMLQRANPLPAPPSSVGGQTIEFALPVQFRWRD